MISLLFNEQNTETTANFVMLLKKYNMSCHLKN